MKKKYTIIFMSSYKINMIGFNYSIKYYFLVLFTLIFCHDLSAQVTIFSENFETAVGPQNPTTPAYLGWQSGQFATTPPTNNNYFWIFDNTRCNVISGTHSMAVSINTPVTTGTRPEYRTNRVASTLVYRTVPINAINYTNLTLDFNWICQGEVGFDYGTVLYSLDGATWAALPGFYEGQSTVQNVTNLDLSVVDGQSFYLGFGWDNDNSAGTFPGFIIDDIFVKGILQTPCTTPNPPTALTLVPTGNSINGSFAASAPVPSGYLVVVSTSATAPNPVNGTPYTIGSTVGAGYTVVDNDTNTTFTAAGLNPSTTYYIYVFAYNANCLGGPRYSAGSLSGFTTTTNSTYCTPSTTSSPINYKYINDVQFIGTLNDVSNLGNNYFQPNPTTCVLTGIATGYQNWTCRPKSIQAQGEGINIYVGSSTGRGRYKAWVDWNKDGLFDNNPANGELVYTSGGVLTTTTSFGFVIPINQPIGDYRIRIRFHGATNNAGAELGGAYNFTACQNFVSGGGQRHYGEAEDYLFTVVQSCPAKITSITNGSTCGPGPATLQVTGTAGVTQYRWYSAKTGGTLVATTTTGTWSPIISATTTYWVTAFNGSCESLVRSKITATLNPITELTILPATPSVCGPDDIIEISATGDTELAYLINEDFEAGGTGVFSVVNIIDNGAATNNLTRWQNRTSTFVPAQLVWKPAISSGFGTNKFAMATSDVNPASGYVWTSLESPVLDSSTFANLTLNFDMYFSKYLTGLDPDNIFIFASTDGGTNWTLVQTYVDDIGYGTNFTNLTVDMSAYINQPNLKISIDYYAIWADGVAVDNVQLFGTRPLSPSFTWTGSPSVDAYTAATALPGQEYSPGTPISTVYIKPSLIQLELPQFTFTANATLSNGCVVSKDITIQNNTKIWQGTSSDWNNTSNWKPGGVPTSTNCVIIPSTPFNAQIDGSTDANAYNLTVLNGGILNVLPGGTITVVDVVSVDAGGVFELQSQNGAADGSTSGLSASLIQVNNVSNTGTITFNRPAFVRTQDYVYWSAPVANYALTNIGSTNNRYKWIPTVAANTPSGYGAWQQTGETMVAGKGYIVRGPNGNGNTAAIPKWNTVTFTGTPRNGTISLPILRGSYTTPGTIGNPNPDFGDLTENDDNWNLVGNPYPSTLDTDAFLTLNSSTNDRIAGTVWLWQHGVQIRLGNNPFFGDFQLNYDAADYLEYNLTGSTGGFSGYIGSGQGFFVLMDDASASGSTIEFNNSMRNSTFDGNAQFFRQNSQSSTLGLERHRIWLDFVNPANQVSTILIGYIEGATSSYDKLYDAPLISGSTKKVFMPNDTNDRKFVIQGKPLPFNEEDIIPISVIVDEAGSHAIAVQRYDGLFETENQNIFIEDLELGIIHDIKHSPYFFTVSSAGTLNNRFVLRYNDQTLGINTLQNSNFTIIGVNDEIKISSEISPINTVVVYDVLGRMLADYKNVNLLDFKFKMLSQTKGTLIVKATLVNGQQKIKRVIY